MLISKNKEIKLSKQTKLLVRKAKSKKLINDCEKTKGDSKKMWKTINRALNKKPKPNVVPDFVETVTTEGETKKVRSKAQA